MENMNNETTPLLKTNPENIKYLIDNGHFEELKTVIVDTERHYLNTISESMIKMGIPSNQRVSIIKRIIQLKIYNEIILKGNLNNKKVKTYAMTLYNDFS